MSDPTPQHTIEETKPKPLLKSRTIAVNIVIIIGSFIPPVGEWIKANPEDTLIMLGAVNIILRLITKERVVLWSKTSVGLLALGLLCLFTLPACRHNPAEVRALESLDPLPVPGFEHVIPSVPSVPSVPSPEVRALEALDPLPVL